MHYKHSEEENAQLVCDKLVHNKIMKEGNSIDYLEEDSEEELKEYLGISE